MHLNPIKANMTELTFERDGSLFKVLFSYKTPVAAIVNGDQFKSTNKKWSRTTSHHISTWFKIMGADQYKSIGTYGQEYFDNLIAGVK